MLPDRLTTLLVAVDFSAASGQAAAIGGYLASAHDARLVALHAESFDVPPYFTMPQIAVYEAEKASAREQATGFLSHFVAQHTAWEAELRIVEERPAEAILQASAAADLVLMGTHGRRGPSRWWMGSVAERVVRGCDRPVLVLHDGAAHGKAPAEVFGRVMLTRAGTTDDAAAEAWLRRLVTPLGGIVESTGDLGACDPTRFLGASVVAAVLPAAAEIEALSELSRLLLECQRPTLFLRP
jgi:nucleotide-binding universal stress UspA family protein